MSIHNTSDCFIFVLDENRSKDFVSRLLVRIGLEFYIKFVSARYVPLSFVLKWGNWFKHKDEQRSTLTTFGDSSAFGLKRAMREFPAGDILGSHTRPLEGRIDRVFTLLPF